MTRTTDPDPEPFEGLGELLPRPQAPTPAPRRRIDDDLPPGIERGPDGRLRTTSPLPKGHS